MNIEIFELKTIMQQMSELGVANYMKTVQPVKDKISQRKAYDTFGEIDVRRWFKNGLIGRKRTGEKDNSKIHYSYAELLACQKAEKMLNYKF
jgi:transcription initiation factor IIE alpha subunit